MELTFAQQSVAFGYSFILGLFLAVFYGALKFLRYAFSPGKTAVVILDILFMLVWAMSVFFFSLAYLMGFIRLHVIAGSVAGFLLYRLTAGRLLFRIYSPVIRFIKRILKKILLKLKIFANYLLKIVGKVLYNISRKKQRDAAPNPAFGERDVPSGSAFGETKRTKGFPQRRGENKTDFHTVKAKRRKKYKRKKHEVKKAKNKKGSGNR